MTELNSNIMDFILDRIDRELEDQDIYEQTIKQFNITNPLIEERIIEFINNGA